MTSSRSPASGSEPPTDLVAALLQNASYRRYVTDQMMWQVPALSLTAQSFLLIITLGNGGRPGRVMAAALGTFAAIAAIQLLLKHRYNEETASRVLERLELDHNLVPIDARPDVVQAFAWPDGVHGWDSVEGNSWWLRSGQRLRRWLVKPRSYLVWTYTLLLFAIADALSGLVIAVS